MTTSPPVSQGAGGGRKPWLDIRPRDVVVALGVTVAQVGGTTVAASHQHGSIAHGSIGPLGYVLLAGSALALVVRRRYPVAVLAAAGVLTLAYWTSTAPRGPVFFALITACIGAIVAGRRRPVIAILTIGYVSFQWLPALLGTHQAPLAVNALFLGAWLLVLLMSGEWIRARRQRQAALSRSREEESRRRASDERLRIARELHDVLAHDISLINVQASTALHLMDRQPERAREALAAIKDVSKEALVELRSVLGILRQVDEAAPLSPGPTLERLDDLVSRTQATGLQVRLERQPPTTPMSPLPNAVDQAAYRIVQEALTNVTRHAGASTATVRIHQSDDGLVVEIEDDGRSNDHPAASNNTQSAAADPTRSAAAGPTRSAGAGPTRLGGAGIPGMRERAAALGGNLQADIRPGGGFRVRAWLPLPVDRAAGNRR